VIEGLKGYTGCILQNRVNEGQEMKAAFKGSFKLRCPWIELETILQLGIATKMSYNNNL